MTRPRHVLHVLNGASGGAALSTIGLIEGLAHEDITSSFVCHTAGSDDDRARLLDAVDGRGEFTPLAWWNRKTRAAAWRRGPLAARQLVVTRAGRRSGGVVAAAAVRSGTDLIHTNTSLTPEGAIAARSLRLPHVWHIREMIGPGQPFRFALEPLAIRVRLARRATIVLANSHAAAACIADWVPAAKLRVVHNGIDTRAFEHVMPPVEHSPVVVAMVANVTSQWKRHDLFVEAIGRARAATPMEFRIFGHTPAAGTDGYADRLRQRVAELGIGAHVGWMDHVDDPVEMMRGIDVLVHPASGESFGRIVVEAMAAARPVIGVRAGGVAELVDDGSTGLLVDPDDASALAEAIGALADDWPRRRALGIAGRRVAQRRWTIDQMTDGVLRAYEEAMEGTSGRRRQPRPLEATSRD